MLKRLFRPRQKYWVNTGIPISNHLSDIPFEYDPIIWNAAKIAAYQFTTSHKLPKSEVPVIPGDNRRFRLTPAKGGGFLVWVRPAIFYKLVEEALARQEQHV